MNEKLLKQLSKKMTASPDDYMTSFRKNLLTYVNEKEIALHDIAEAADLSPDTVKTLIYGDAKDCKLSTAVALAKALKISVDELVGAGTLSDPMRESIQITRNLPESFVYFVRWSIRYHERMLRENKASKKSINVIIADFDGNLHINNNFELLDISDLPDSIRPKIYMGIRIPCEYYMPIYMEGDILLLANDRIPMPNECAVVVVHGNVFILRKKGNQYFSIRDGRFIADVSQIEEVIGYIAHVSRDASI